MSFENVDTDCVLDECDAVVSVTYRAYTYQVLLTAWHHMARDWEIRWEFGYGQFTGTG